MVSTAPLPTSANPGDGWDFNFGKLKSLCEEVFIHHMGVTPMCGEVIMVTVMNVP